MDEKSTPRIFPLPPSPPLPLPPVPQPPKRESLSNPSEVKRQPTHQPGFRVPRSMLILTHHCHKMGNQHRCPFWLFWSKNRWPWFAWWFNHLPGPSFCAKRTPMGINLIHCLPPRSTNFESEDCLESIAGNASLELLDLGWNSFDERCFRLLGALDSSVSGPMGWQSIGTKATRFRRF